MPVDDRGYVRGEHPPACTCKECAEKRLASLKRNQSPERGGQTAKEYTEKKPANVREAWIPRKLGRKIAEGISQWIPAGIGKSILSLLVIAGVVDLCRRGYVLFVHQNEPIRDTIMFLVEGGVWVGAIYALRRRRYLRSRPSFKLILASVLVVTLVCAFAGVEPLASYKQNTQDFIADEIVPWFSDLFSDSNGGTPAEHLRVRDMWGLEFAFGVQVYVQLESTPNTEPGTYDITLLAGKEDFGTEKVVWLEGEQLKTIWWGIGPDSSAFAQLARGRMIEQVFQVSISSDPN